MSRREKYDLSAFVCENTRGLCFTKILNIRTTKSDGTSYSYGIHQYVYIFKGEFRYTRINGRVFVVLTKLSWDERERARAHFCFCHASGRNENYYCRKRAFFCFLW